MSKTSRASSCRADASSTSSPDSMPTACAAPACRSGASEMTANTVHVARAPIRDRKVRFALVGCGRISANHMQAIVRHAEAAELTDVCDVDPAALSAAVAKTGARGHSSFSSLVSTSKADCVVLTTPSGLHPAQAMEAARAGFDVMTEKP